jgi:hypothetical protein
LDCFEPVRRHKKVTDDKKSVTLQVYNPFFIQDFKIDPAEHQHHQDSSPDAIVTIVKQREPFASGDGWTYLSPSDQGKPWTYSGEVLPKEAPHHQRVKLPDTTQVKDLVPTELRVAGPHKGAAGNHHPSSAAEVFTTTLFVNGTRTLGKPGEEVEVPWQGPVKEAPELGTLCQRETRATDSDPHPYDEPTPTRTPTPTRPPVPTDGGRAPTPTPSSPTDDGMCGPENPDATEAPAQAVHVGQRMPLSWRLCYMWRAVERHDYQPDHFLDVRRAFMSGLPDGCQERRSERASRWHHGGNHRADSGLQGFVRATRGYRAPDPVRRRLPRLAQRES